MTIILLLQISNHIHNKLLVSTIITNIRVYTDCPGDRTLPKAPKLFIISPLAAKIRHVRVSNSITPVPKTNREVKLDN